jgi:hypothetical protein
LTSFSEFNILSLGCGSCADLFGINNFLTEQSREISVKYMGVDSNPKWKPTQDKIKEIFPTYDISFEQIDVFDFLDNIPEYFTPPNILILQYLLNELIKCNDTAKMDEFVEKLVDEVINKMPDDSVIILNDINHYSVRNWFSRLHSEIIKYKTASFLDYRFTNPIDVPVKITTHEKDTLLFHIPAIITSNYSITNSHTRSQCSSSQAIITIKTK